MNNEKPKLPAELYDGLTDVDEFERRARIGRFMVLKEMGFFGLATNLALARAGGEGSWVAQVRKRFSGRYGDVAGCHPADLEIAAEMLGVFDDIYDVELSNETKAA